MGKSFASAEDQVIFSFYGSLRKMKLITDKDGKPIKWETVYPPLNHLIESCKEDKIKLPKNPKIGDVLSAMLQAGYSNVKHPRSTEDEIKSWDENVFNKEIAKLGLYPIPKSAKSEPVGKKGAKAIKKEFKAGDEPTIPPVEDDNDKEWDQDVQDEEKAVDGNGTTLSIVEAMEHIGRLRDHNEIDVFMEGEEREEVIKTAVNRIEELAQIASSGKK